jgi:hypothetical protein
MRATILPLLCLFGSVLAIPTKLTSQDITIIERSITTVSGTLKRLTTAIHALDKDLQGDIAKQEYDVMQRGDEVTLALQDGARRIRSNPMIDMIEATRLLDPVNSLTAVTETTVNTWIAAKPIIVRLGGTQPVLKLMGQHELATDDFIDSIVSRLPELTKAFGRLAAQRSKSSIQQAQKAFRS